MDRKEFFSKVFVGGGSFFFAPAVLDSCSTNNSAGTTGNTTIDLNSSDFAALKNVGGFAYSGNVVIFRTSETAYTAVSRICTHEGCTVSFDSASKRLVCPCHGAQYSNSGLVLQGPATRSLTVYTTKIVGTTLTIS